MAVQSGNIQAKQAGVVSQDQKTNTSKFSLLFSGSPARIWKSRISWRITLVVFLTILTVQAAILNITAKDFEQSRLLDLRETGRSAIVPLINTSGVDFFASPFEEADVNRLLSTTRVNGLVVYASDLSLIERYGEPTALTVLDQYGLDRKFYSPDGSSYETIFRSNDLSRPYIILARFDSGHIKAELENFIRQTIIIMLLMSAFVTAVLMIALGHWLLEPILFMRNNLIAASKNPEDPEIDNSPYDGGDEIGEAIEIAQKLIYQNADNMHRMKSAAEDKIHKLAYYDTLTGLPNRTMFLEKLAEATRELKDNKNMRFAVITVDLDHFKDINDSMGHNVGDAILRAVGKRLRSALPDSATVSRTGEDEYAIMMSLASGTSAYEIATRIAGVVRNEPFKVFTEEFQVRSSIGVSTFPDNGTDPDQVLKNADIALNRAKEDGRDTIKEYSEDFDRMVQQRFQMLRDLRDALELEQFQLFYQPQLDLKSGKIIGAEALLRWWKPDNSKDGGSFISPGEFIPVAEQSGLILPIGEWVMKRACQDAKAWREKHGIDASVAINISAAQFTQSNLVANVKDVLKDTGIDPNRLELEVTESLFMDDVEHTIDTLHSLSGLGIEISIDDFGTGYSSLSYLRQFPIDRLKIDQSFIRNALNNPDDASIAETIVALGHSLNLKVIAEGVETKDHESFLVEKDCDEVQGYRYSRPVPLSEFITFAKNYNEDLGQFDKS